MVSKIKKLLVKYPVIIGYLSICALMGIIVCYWYYSRHKEITATVVPPELERESNLEMLDTPEEAAEYFIYALKNEDIDQFMRIFPVDELCLKRNFSQITNLKEALSINMPAPAREYRDYFPLTSNEITGIYTDMFLSVVDEMENISEAEVEKIRYIAPEEQLKTDFQLQMLEQSETYGAEAFCDMETLVKIEGETWSIPLTLANFDGYWKVFRVGSSFQENIEREAASDIESNSRAEKELEKKLEELVKKNEKKADKEDDGDRKGDTRKLIESGEAFLPPNYVVTNAVYGESPEKVMRLFTRYLQKKDLAAVLTLGNTGTKERVLEKVTSEVLREQRDFAQIIKSFCYFFFIEENTQEELTLQELEMTGQELLSRLDPQFFFYLEMKEMVQINTNEYEIYFRYENNYYKFNFEFLDFSQGWQIKNIKAEKKMTEKEYQKEIQKLQK